MCILHFKAKKKKVLSNYNLPMFTTQNSLTNTPKKKKKTTVAPLKEIIMPYIQHIYHLFRNMWICGFTTRLL